MKNLVAHARAITLAMAFILSSVASQGAAPVEAAAPADAAKSAPPIFKVEPLYEVRIKRASQLQDFFRKNDWMQEFQKTTLFRGLTLGVGPALTLLAKPDDAWQGRLVDALLTQAVSDKTLEFDYYPRRILSPWALRVQNLGSAEKQIFEKIMKGFSGGEKKVFRVSSERLGNVEKQIGVYPLKFSTEKFAWAIDNNCITIGRDPSLVAQSSSYCGMKTTAPEQDAEVVVQTRDLVPSLKGVLGNFYQTKSELRIALKWNSQDRRFDLASAKIPTLAPGRFPKGEWPKNLLKALPASSLLVASQFVPEPTEWNLEQIQKSLALPVEEWKNKKLVPVTLVYLGSYRDPKTEVVSQLSALLVPVTTQRPEALTGISSFFSGTKHYEVGFRKVCQNILAFSPDAQALSLIESACKGKTASFQHLPLEMLSLIQGQKNSTLIYVSPSKLLTSMLELGAKENKWTEAQIRQSRTLIGEIPSLGMVGSAVQNDMLFQGVLR